MSKNKIFWIAIVIWALYFVWQIVGSIFILFPLVEKYQMHYLWQLPFTIIPGIILYIIMNNIYRKHHYQTMYFLPPTHAKIVATPFRNRTIALLVGIIISTMIVVIVGIFMQLRKDPSNTTSFITFAFWGGSWVTNIYMLSPAISEEIMVRAGLLHAFLVKGNKKTGIIISSSLFGLMHLASLIVNNLGFTLENIIWIVNLALIGLVLSYIYIRFGLFSAIFFHWFWNASFQRAAMMQVEKDVINTLIAISVVILGELFIRHTQSRRPPSLSH